MIAAGRPGGPRTSAANLQETFQHYRSRIAILFVLCVLIYFLMAFGEQAWRARQLQAEAAQQRAAIASIERENAALQEQLDLYATDAWLDYVQARGRRDLNLANPGETVLLVRWGAPTTAPAVASTATPVPANDDTPNWKRWLDVFAGD